MLAEPRLLTWVRGKGISLSIQRKRTPRAGKAGQRCKCEGSGFSSIQKKEKRGAGMGISPQARAKPRPAASEQTRTGPDSPET